MFVEYSCRSPVLYDEVKPTECLAGARVTVMGLGSHGGGAETARWLARQGALVTVTDLRPHEELSDSLAALAGLPLRFELGRHLPHDFEQADIVVKNPAVAHSSRYLRLARRIETDISLFLTHSDNPLLAVTGTKGKSTVSSAIEWVLKRTAPGARRGGNSASSPLTFVDELHGAEPIILELSSFQLGDLPLTTGYRRLSRHWPRVAIVTNLLSDHLDWYDSIEDYVADKRIICAMQSASDWLLCGDAETCTTFTTKASVTTPTTSDAPLPGLRLRGAHTQRNLQIAATALRLWGIHPETIQTLLAGFPGLEHRLEFVARCGGVDFYNDSAATIPPATLAAVRSFERPPVLIAGGSDKEVTLSPFLEIAQHSRRLLLLAGAASNGIASLLAHHGLPVPKRYDDLDACLHDAFAAAHPGDALLLSPGCASFGLFRNEFDRGRRFKQAVARICGSAPSDFVD